MQIMQIYVNCEKLCKLKTSQHNHSMSNFGPFFLLSKRAEFSHVVSDLIESHSPVFFSDGLHFIFQLKRMQKTRRRFLQSVVEQEAIETFCFPEQSNQ